MKPRRPTSVRSLTRAGPELLAPAGSLETWAAALEAGADAIYLGLKSFSARTLAPNFTLTELTRILDLTHERGARIFLAFNALLKEDELKTAAELLDRLSRFKPDALIVQDPGLLRLIKKYYPVFEVHASTLLAVHNQPGLNMLKDLGFARAVLARELSLDEVENLLERSPLGLELFIHGALCFSFSGLCLMSSFLGGRGSLRGACTQPCRRVYTQGRKQGYFFSPTDLDASALMGRIRKLPLAALKIEGRMKGAEYVTQVVRAYRLLLDAAEEEMPAALAEARSLIGASLGRKRSIGFLAGVQAVAALAPSHAATSGEFMGQVLELTRAGVKIKLRAAVAAGDRLRVKFKAGEEQRAFTLKRMFVQDREAPEAAAGQEVILAAPEGLAPGDLIFKVDAAARKKDMAASALARAVKSAPPWLDQNWRPSPAWSKIKAEWGGKEERPPSQRRVETWYRLPRAQDLLALDQVKADRVILPLNRANLRRLSGLRRRLGEKADKVIWSLPPLVFGPALAGLRRDLAETARMGARGFMISNLGHLPLFSGWERNRRTRPTVYADYRLNCLNTQAESLLAGLGLAGVTLSLESDEENLKAMFNRPAAVRRLLYLYGRPPLFTSRFRLPGLKESQPLVSPQGERFRLWQEDDGLKVTAEQPVFFSSLLKYRSLPGVSAFIVDLEFDPRPAAAAREVSQALGRGRPLRQASRFNFQRGLF
ncbi:MAG: peptidase U32 family protein [Thermodesulfobacteriota bacterium]